MTQQIFNPGPSSLRTARMLSYRVPRPTVSFPGPSPAGHTKLGLRIPRLGKDDGGLVQSLQNKDAIENKYVGPGHKWIYNDNVKSDYDFAGANDGMVQGYSSAFVPEAFQATGNLDPAPYSGDLARGGRVARAPGGQIPDSPRLPFVGPIMSSGAGRADTVPMHVPSGAYVIPADVISHMGQGNSIAGMQIAKLMFGPNPRGESGGPWGAPLGKPTMGRGVPMPRAMPPRFIGATGMPKPTPAGPAPGPATPPAAPYGSETGRRPTIAPVGMNPGHMEAHGGSVETGAPATPIAASGGEFVIPPAEVRRRGNGDIHKGHRLLDRFVKMVRADHIKTLQTLPGPAQN